jgi:hypothetical protein
MSHVIFTGPFLDPQILLEKSGRFIPAGGLMEPSPIEVGHQAKTGKKTDEFS